MTSSVLIQVAVNVGITFLKDVYCTTPFKVANITEDKKSKELQLMLMSSSPGILDGDEYELKIELVEGSCVRLQTQSYQRLFSMKQSATQSLDVHMAKECSFCFLPHPSVPHKNSVYTGTNKFYLSDDCTLIFGEILTCGRKLNGEVFSFSKYHNFTEVFINNKLIVKENLLIEPATINLHAIGQLEGFTHQASLIYLCENSSVKELSKALTELLGNEMEIEFGISELAVNGLIVRLLGQKAEQLHNCLLMITEILKTVSAYKLIRLL